MLRLTMLRGPTPGAVYELGNDEITIGRGNKNSIVIRDNEVSRDHCRLVRLTEHYEVHDLNSSNGTFVNGQRVVSSWLLQPGALIELGDSITLQYGTASVEGATSEKLPLATETITNHSLVLLQGPDSGSVYPLTGVTQTLGRDPTCDILIADPEVSRYHLRLYAAPDGYQIEDLGSTNGTFVNDQALLDITPLQADDVIRLGTLVRLQYLRHEEALESGDEDTPVIQTHELNRARGDIFPLDSKRRALSARSTGIEPGSLHNHLIVVYAREDWETVVAPLLVRLQDTRLNAWVDQYLTLDTDAWRLAVEQALKECWLMLLVVSPAALGLPYIRTMYRYFLSENKPVIPLLHDMALTLPGDLNRLRSLVYDPETNPRSFHKLIFEIMQLHQQPE